MPFQLLFFESSHFAIPKITSNLLRKPTLTSTPISTPLFPSSNTPIHHSRTIKVMSEQERTDSEHVETDAILGFMHLMVDDKEMNPEDKVHHGVAHPVKGWKGGEEGGWKAKQGLISTPLFNQPNAIPWSSGNIRRRYSTSTTAKKKVAVVLSGCGVKDGSEIHESVSLLVHLSRAGADTSCFAPNINQADTINHANSTTSDEKRNVLTESARISRGNIKPLLELKAADFSAVVFPGGYGAAKNLSTFASKGEHCTIQTDVERVIKEFHAAKKPIGLCCIAPVLAAKLIPGVRITVGNEDKDTSKVVERMGAVSQPASAKEVVVDEKNNVISTPAYMTNSPLYEIFVGIGNLVDNVIARAK